MHKPVVIPALVACALLWTVACRKSITEQAMESDANGYICKAGHKFYTDRAIFAEKCPTCATLDLFEVHAYVCETPVPSSTPPLLCGHLNLAPRLPDKGGGVLCEKCGAPVSAVRLPRSQQLENWQAKKSTRAAVLLKP